MIRLVSSRKFARHMRRGAAVVLCVALVVLGDPALLPGRAQQPAVSSSGAQQIPSDQLDSLVAPIALYPDPLLGQVLAASTYPLEIIQLQQFLAKNKDLKDQALADAVAKQNWDPTVQALAGLPEVVKRLADDIQWTTDLGDAFLAQESDVMAAVQRMRKKAQQNGALKSDDKMVVETEAVGSNNVIVIQQANPQVIYVPSYNPTVVYGPPVYAYPPIYYQPPGYYAAGVFFAWGVGVAMGAFWRGGWCCNAGWGGNNITINNNNNFVRNSNNRTNISGGNRTDISGGNGTWQHNPQHRGGAPYGDRATANRYGGAARGEARPGQGGRPQQGAGNRPGGGGASPAVQNRPGGGGASPAVQNRPSGGGASPALQTRPGGGNADRVGGQSLSRSGAGGGGGALGGGAGPGGGYNGSSAGAAGNRGASSMGSKPAGGGGGGGAPARKR